MGAALGAALRPQTPIDARQAPRQDGEMIGTERILYQFPISHFCEKTRWNLDAKGLSYRVHDLVPGPHVVAVRWLGARTVPVLVDGATTLGDSAAIAQHLERAYPRLPLLPRDEAARARVLELEAYFGKRAGRAVRQWMYGQLGERSGGMAEALMAAYPRAVRFAAKLTTPLLERAMRQKYRIDAEGIASARRVISEVLDRIEHETSGDPERYLAGDALSLADVTAASLLGPLVAPPESPWAVMAGPRVPASITALRAELGPRPGWAWVLARYARDRRRASV
jgi:glutathione S-transferase